MGKTFKDLSPKQVEALARKNREASQQEVNEELKKRGVDKKKQISYVYVDRSEDPKISNADHRSIFKEMKKRPYED